MKLCNRDYTGDSMLSIKVIDGVKCCALCEKPTQMHGKSIEQRALYWSLAGDTGVSSETIANHMTGNNARRWVGPPSDASDRGRCIRLLELIPEWIPRLQELIDTETPQDSMVISSSGISSDRNSWAKQIPLIMREGGF